MQELVADGNPQADHTSAGLGGLLGRSRAVYEGGGTLMCTPYGPNALFNIGNAMGRNKLIYAQAALTVAVASTPNAAALSIQESGPYLPTPFPDR